MPEFKDTIMGKMTIGAIKNWGENDKDGNWYRPTQEQAEAMVSEGGVYPDAETATNNKTYGSELAAIDGLVELIAKSEGITPEETEALKEQMKTEIYTQPTLSADLSARISGAMEVKGVEASILEVLATIHDNWVKSNGKKFDAPGREKKLYQFTDLRLMEYGGDGATADLLFLQPILEGAGIEVDRDRKLKEEFESQKQEYLDKHGIKDLTSLRDYLMNSEENYPPLSGVMTTKGGKLTAAVSIIGELQNPEILDRMTSLVAAKNGIREVVPAELKAVAEKLPKDISDKTAQALTGQDEQTRTTGEQEETIGE